MGVRVVSGPDGAGRRPSGMPTSDIDPWAPAVLADPYPAFAALREAGPAVWLEQHQLVALPRYEEVRAALTRWHDFTSAEGISASPMTNAAMPPNIISTDPPEHDVFRQPVATQLSQAALAADIAEIEATAGRFADAVAAAGRFDGVADLARPYSLTVVSDLVGFPEGERDAFPHLAEVAFNVMGATNERTGPGLQAFGEIVERCMRIATTGVLCPGRRGVELVEAGQPLMLISYTWPGVDTTVNAVAAALHLFARHPDQWELVRRDRELIPSAFAEVLRLHSPVHHFARVATADVEFDGVTVPAGSRVLVMYASANRDERRYPDPDRFDVTRNPSDHLAFGRGIHLCVGHNLAKAEGHAILAALADRVERFEPAGDPEWIVNNTLHGLGRLPLTAVPAA